jgi:hypothetical protein
MSALGLRWSVLAAVLAGAFVLSLGGVAAADARRPRVGYLGSRFQPRDADFQDKLDAGIVRGIGATSVLYVPLSNGDLPRNSGEICATEDCLKTAASRHLVDYFVLADVRSGTTHGVPSYQVSLQLIQPAPFEVPMVAELKCEPCIPESLAEKADIAASRLMADLIHSREAPPVIHVKAPAPDGPGLSVTAPGATPERSWLSRRWPWVVVAAGGAAAITGAVLVFGVGNRSACDGVPGGKCGSTTDYRRPGWAAGSAGVGALLLGGGFALWGRF